MSSYSPQRLAKARALFQRGSSVFRTIPQLTGPYHLRNRAPKRASVLASWHDNDQDEDYDPFTERIQKRKFHSCQAVDSDPRPSKKTTNASLSSSLTSGRNDDAEYDDPPSPNQSEHSEPDNLGAYWAITPNTETTNSRYRFRPRVKDELASPPQVDGMASVEAKASVLSSDTQPINELPSRGCKACQEISMECPLATDPDPLAYPCNTCAQDGIECVVTPEPEWKRSCEGCRKRRGFCSYRYADYDHSQPCQPCINHGFQCVAGPARYRSLLFQADGSTSFEELPTPPHDTQQPQPSGAVKTEPPEVIAISDESPGAVKTGSPEVIVISDEPSSAKKTEPPEIIVISDDESDDAPNGPPSVIYISDSPDQQVSPTTCGAQAAMSEKAWEFYWHR